MPHTPRTPRSAGDPTEVTGATGADGTGVRFARREVAPGVTFHLNTSPRRKTNLLNLFWVGALGDDVTARALLPNLQMRGSREHPTLQALTRETERLYGASLSTDVRKIGERHVIQFRFEFVNDGYIPGGESILTESIEFLHGVVARPNLTSEGFFAEDVVRQEKENHKRLIESTLNDKRSYAMQRCIEETCRNESFQLHEQGRVEDLDAIDGRTLASLWRTLFDRSITHVYFSGDLPIEETEDALSTLFEGHRDRPDALPPLPPPRPADGGREVVERMTVQQAKLCQSYRTGVSFDDPRMVGLVVGNGILGSFAHSKLFVNVREGASLCYYASSSIERTHGLLLISSGIDVAKREQAQSLIQEQVDDVRAGNFTSDELEATKRALVARLTMLEDSPSGLMDLDLAWGVNGVAFDLAAYRDAIAAVDRDAVVAAFEPLSPDVVYFLAPEGDASAAE